MQREDLGLQTTMPTVGLNASSHALSALTQRHSELPYAPALTADAESTQKLADQLTHHAMVASVDELAPSTHYNAMYYISQPQGARPGESGQEGSAYQRGAEPKAARAQSSSQRRGPGRQVMAQTRIARQISVSDRRNGKRPTKQALDASFAD